VGDGVDAEEAPGAELGGYELWDRTQRAGHEVADAYARLVAAGSAPARVAAAPGFLQAARRLLALRLTAVAGDRRRAFPARVPPAAGRGVAALWAEVFWAARSRSPDDGSGALEAADAALRGLLTLQPAELADPGAVRVWGDRLRLVEDTLGGLEMEAQATVEALQATAEHDR
jgi:hypothetical protein